MMVGDHRFQAQFPGDADGLDVGDAAVYRHKHVAPGGNGPHGGLVQAVALGMPGGQVHLWVRPHAAQGEIENGGGADAVHVIIAIYADFFLPHHCVSNQFRRFGNAPQRGGIVHHGGVRTQKGAGLFRGADSPGHQQPVQRLRHAFRTFEFCLLRISGDESAHVKPSPLNDKMFLICELGTWP